MLLSCLLLFFLSARELDNSQAKMQDEEVSVFPGGIAEKKDKDFDQIHVQVVQKSAETETEETTKPHNS